MTANVETMMYVGETPWHGIGNELPADPSIEDAIKAAGLDWRVALEPLFTAGGARCDHRATVRDSDQRVLGVVGPRYHVLQNEDAFKWFQPFVDSGLASIESAGSLRNGERVWVLARVSGHLPEVVPGDLIRRYLLLSHGHDGKLAARCGLTNTRVVCENTLSAAHTSAESALLRMTHHRRMLETLEQVREIISLANSAFEATIEQYRALATRPIHREDLRRYVKKVFTPDSSAREILARQLVRVTDEESAARELGSASGDVVLPRIEALFEGGPGAQMAGARGTWWGAFNAVTAYLTHESGSSRESRLNSLWFGRSAGLGQRALEHASAMSVGGAA